jgi:epoxyqueuosine reductase
VSAQLLDRIALVLEPAGCSFGVTGAEPFLDTREAIERAVAEERHAGLGFTFSRPEVATDVRASFPWAESLVVAARPYVPASGSPGPAHPGSARVARFATEDHYAPLRLALGEVAGLLRSAGRRAEVLVDDSRLADRAAAIRAGVAWPGKSTLTLVPGAGPWVLLGTVVTDAPLPRSKPMRRDCGTCDACIPACPTGAIIAPGVLDARLCLSAILQSPGWIPMELRIAVGDRLYGCDDCLEACPPGLRALGSGQRGPGRFDLLGLLAADDVTLRNRFPHFFVPRNEGRYLRRNAIVALGNAGGSSAGAVLAGYCGHHDPLIRGHAAWALGRVGGSGAVPVLRSVAQSDPDPDVRAEAEAALGTLL